MTAGAGVGFTVGWLTGYLRARLGGPVEVERLERFGRGTSRETWFATYRLGTEPPVTITLRADHPAGSVDPTPLDQEYFIYERLGGAGLPVARALWWEDDPAKCPRPFYARAWVKGHWLVEGYTDPAPQADAIRIGAARAHVQALARVHALDWRSLGFGARLLVPASPAAAAHACVENAARRYAARRGEPVPIFHEACEWLRDHAPAASRLCLCKGTNGLGEEVFADGALVALSDWEEVSIGDPASDFAFMQGFADPIVRDGRQIWGLEQALACYAEAAGPQIPLASVRYYQVVRALNIVVFARNAAAICHETPEQATIRQVWTGTEVLHIGKRVLASAMGLLPPPSAGWFAELNQTVDLV
jgi:aminoglycoside phosphotransferase (APT) family kinase protein